jgi:hypothetical protein
VNYHKSDKILPLNFLSKLGSNKRSMVETIARETKKEGQKKAKKNTAPSFGRKLFPP